MQNHICTITPNPTLDLGGTVNRIKPNEKTYVHAETRHPGGNGVNVARILTRLKIPVLATGFLGGGIGKEIENLLNQEKVQNKFIRIRNDSRISITVSNQSDHRQTRLSFSGPTIQKEEKDKLFKLIGQSRGISLIVLGGSMPPGFSSEDLIKIIKSAHQRKIETIVDCPGMILRDILNAGPLLIKPNLTEFQELTGTNVRSLSGVFKEAKNLLNKVPLICVSSVEDGALLVTRSSSFFGRIPKIKIRSTVGAGDSMVGAMAAQIYKGNSAYDDILRWGLAASAATLVEQGTALGVRGNIFRLYRRIKINQVG